MSTDNITITASTEAKTGETQSNTTQPSTPQNPSINQLLREAQDGTNDNDDSPPTKCLKYVQLMPEQFKHILNSCTLQKDFISKFTRPSLSSILHSQHHHSSPPAYYNNAKYEEISCRYDELEDQLVPFEQK